LLLHEARRRNAGAAATCNKGAESMYRRNKEKEKEKAEGRRGRGGRR
jgi:hypothetical protein